MSLLERYLAGEHAEVWAELLAAPSIPPEAPAIVAEALARFSRNVDVLIARLTEVGFRFGQHPDGDDHEHWSGDDPLRTAPEPSLLGELAEIGPVPLSLQGFWRSVGGVNLIGYHPDWDLSILELDPLFVFPLTEAELDNIRELAAEGVEEPLELAPDSYHKDDTSGGSPYAMAFGECVDSLFTGEPQGLLFVDYLRSAIRWGGFPGLAKVGAGKLTPSELAYLTRDLEPF